VVLPTASLAALSNTSITLSILVELNILTELQTRSCQSSAELTNTTFSFITIILSIPVDYLSSSSSSFNWSPSLLIPVDCLPTSSSSSSSSFNWSPSSSIAIGSFTSC